MKVYQAANGWSIYLTSLFGRAWRLKVIDSQGIVRWMQEFAWHESARAERLAMVFAAIAKGE